jgi:3-oxoacyl-[acyl-carrier protein] reductase
MMARACVPVMVAQGFGRVVNISTSQVTMVRTGYCPYGPSKAALEAMSVIWAKDLRGRGVAVNVLLPGGAANTRLLPGSGSNRRGADGQLLSPALMRAPIVWLMGRADESVSGQRFVARLWPEGLDDEAAAAQARSEPHELPAVM